MPPFPRLGRHSNRSQQALVNLPAAPAAAVVAAGGGTGEATSLNQAQAQSPSRSLNPSTHLPPGQSQSQSNHHQFHRPNHHPYTHNQAEAQSATDSSPSNTTAPPSLISTNTNTTAAESSIADPRAAHQPPASELPPPQQLEQAQPHPNEIGIAISGVPLPPPYKQQPQPYTASPILGPGESPVLEGGQYPAFTPSPVNRTQSQRFSSYASIPPQPLDHQSHHHLRNQLAHGIGSASVEHLPATRSHPNSPPQLNPFAASEKRSKRNIIKGFFSNTSRSHNDQHPQPSSHGFTLGHHRGQSSLSYENGVGLTRRQSRRASNLLDSQTQSPITSPNPSDRDWHTPGAIAGPGPVYQQGTEPAPLQGIGKSTQNQYTGPEPAQLTQSPSSQHLVGTPTIRQVNAEADSSSTYEEVGYHQGQPNQQDQKEVAPPPHPPPHQQQQQEHSQAQGQTPPSQQPHAQALPQAQEQAHGYNHTVFEQQQQPLYHLANASPSQPRHSEEQQFTPDPHSAATSVQYPNSETLSQLSHESPITSEPDQRANNQQPAQISPSVEHPARTQEPGSTPNLPPAHLASSSVQQSTMAPPPGAPPSERRPGGEREPRPVALRSQAEVPPPGVPPGPPPGYRQNNSSAGQLTPLQPGAPQQGQPGPPPTPYTSGEHGRHSPAPPDPHNPESEKAFKDLLTKYKNVKRLYFDGKAQIENFGRQIEQLQNAVANQRMSQSRTALDDSEYSNRFNRLNGAINNLAFNIRKDWRSAPPWLAQYVSSDALKTGKQEMTAVGRAVISRWLMDHIFNSVFHPGLNPVLSSHLKEIELSIRGSAYTLNSQEEFDALTTKIVNWRMATLDGLHSVLNSPATTEHRQNLTAMATSNLTAELYQFLTEPPPSGVEGSASMIVELAIGITANLPLESRDVAIVYPLPGEIVQPGIMEIEKAPLPPLDDTDSGDDKEEKGKTQTEQYLSQTRNSLGDVSPNSWTDGGAASTLEPTSADKGLNSDEPRVRFAGFPALEVRGRQVLMKAPVWAM